MSTSYDEPLPVAEPADGLTLVERSYCHPDAHRLVRGLFAEQVGRYGYADPAAADPALYQPPRGLFLVGHVNGVAVCCGGFRAYTNDTVEIKKMYTVPEHRGRGYGLAIITELEVRAVRAGAQRAILETGVRNTAALGLYESVGYRPTARYVPGRDPAINRAFLKELVAAAVG